MIQSSFDQLATAARAAAEEDAHALGALELMALRDPTGVSSYALERTKQTGSQLGEIYRLLTALKPHETTIKALLGQPNVA